MRTPAPQDDRRHWMAVLARASAAELQSALAAVGALPEYIRLRGPEPGLVMVRGRIGGGGGAFNLGEMTVTRCAIRVAHGTVGHAYIAGRDERRAELAALCDALLQDEPDDGELHGTVARLHAAQQKCRATEAA
ncbi:MAG TPA: phosphonate C-P lyase system protein PhnG, partial [Acetobacteraceae bacterium]|nr:phosphonate C-P lyase system protein PhnG [Acetobacteraceae bacterium]